MSTYLDMWKKVRAMPFEEIRGWIHHIYPSEGRFVDFEGLKVVDIDLMEALSCYYAIRSQEKQRL